MKYISNLHVSLLLGILIILSGFPSSTGSDQVSFPENLISPATYTPKFDPLNIKEQMTLTPMFTPDNALSTHIGWIDEAISSIDIQNQYIKFYDGYDDWETNPTPFVEALLRAKGRGVTIRVQIREESDTFDVAEFLHDEGILVRYMGNSDSNKDDDDWLTYTHNKLMIIDNEVVLISSINFGTAFTNNREAGIVIKNDAAADYFTTIFSSDWVDGQIPSFPSIHQSSFDSHSIEMNTFDYPSHTDIPKTNFTGVYNITLFTNPDNADEVIFNSLKSAKQSIYVSMYTISRPDFNETLIDLKKQNPAIDIQVLVSSRRVGDEENEHTWSAVQSLVDNLIPVYNASIDAFIDKAGFYHNKYWIIDGKTTFVYSGNWSPRSVTPQLEAGKTYYSSGDPNRDMGVAIHDAPDIANFYKNVWDQDVEVADAWELPISIKQSSFSEADVLSGSININGLVNELEGSSVSYRWGNAAYTPVTLTGNSFSVSFDTTSLDNGITTLEVKAEAGGITYTDKVKVNIVNYPTTDNWRFLITEVLPNPDGTDTPKEFFELTNSFPFPLLLEDWQAGDDSALLTFPSNYQISAFTSIIIARDKDGFDSSYSATADFELGIELKNTDDYVQILDNHGNYIDVIAYGMNAPDNSESLDPPDSGESILRVELHIDTNMASDFIYDSPDPKGDVPHISLGASTTDEIRIPWMVLPISFLILISKRRRN
ncbi:MAG: phospholipase D-like domain-containing protein [Candidatus Kariarchaeaceae archaeon]